MLSLMLLLSSLTITPITASAESVTYTDTINGLNVPSTVPEYRDWPREMNERDYSDIQSPVKYNGRTAFEKKNNISSFKIKNEDSGIFTTESGGNVKKVKVKKVTATWIDNNANRTLLVYGKDTPYSSYTELFDEDKRGDLIGKLSFVKGGDSKTLSCTFNGNYPYIAFSVSEGPIYLESLEIEWTAGCAAHDWDAQWSWLPEDGDDPGNDNVSAFMTVTCKNCGESRKVNGSVERTGYDAATCLLDGNAEYTATAELDGKSFSSKKDYTIPKDSTEHEFPLVLVESVAPRYDQEDGKYINGTQEYYECSLCHRIFADMYAENELDSVPVIPYFTFEMTDSHVVLTGYNGHDLLVTVPEKVPENYLEYDPEAQNLVDAPYGIEEIAANVFKDHTELKHVEFSKFIQLVGKSAFEGCSSLEDVKFWDGVGLIKAKAFDGCSSMENFSVSYLLRDGIESPNFDGTSDDLVFYGVHLTGGQKSKLKIAAETFGKNFAPSAGHLYSDPYYLLDGENKLRTKTRWKSSALTPVSFPQSAVTPTASLHGNGRPMAPLRQPRLSALFAEIPSSAPTRTSQ